jgi:putative nucleotidyltransferase with HDIG domain
MNRVEAILSDECYQQRMTDITRQEQNRRFCCHGLSHALDVARIAYIFSLERGCPFDREVIYGMALLHDIGRYTETEEHASHHEAGARIADGILERAGYTPEERSGICRAIEGHRQGDMGKDTLESLLYEADKRSRNCFQCEAWNDCYWDEEKKNKNIYR